MILKLLITNQLNLVHLLTYKYFTTKLHLILRRQDLVILISGVTTFIFLTLQELRRKQCSPQVVHVNLIGLEQQNLRLQVMVRQLQEHLQLVD